ncbi:SixA phosphatase family protein [Salegentibacter sp. F14]
MKHILLLLLLLLSGCQFKKEDASQQRKASQVTTYYFIRHAEKDTLNPQNDDPELTQAGRARARQWAEVFKAVDFDLIFSSNYQRTLNTARPIAESQDKKIEFFNTEKLNDKDFQQKTKGKTVLVVGHSNLNPEFVNYIIGQNKYEDIDEMEYGSLFIVVIHPEGTRTSEVLYFN